MNAKNAILVVDDDYAHRMMLKALLGGWGYEVREADDGAGAVEAVRKEDLGRVFDPYFTTKPSGTGLGLAIVHRIIESHGGEIRLESEPGRGTVFTILLPAGAAGKEQT